MSLEVSVLLVDDNPKNLLALEAILAPLGLRLVRSLSGLEALRCLLERDFAAVVLDLNMPGMDGFETAKLIRGRERSRETPVIFVTAEDPASFPVTEAYALGAVDYLVKPLVPEILRAKVSAFAELYRKNERLRELERRERERAEGRLRASEERFQALIENSYDAVMLVSAEGHILFASPSVTRLLGYRPEEFVGQDGSGFVHPDDQEFTAAELARLVGEPGGTWVLENRIRRRDGSWLWAESVATNLLDNPAVGALVVNFRDISERKRAEQAMDRYRLLSEHAQDIVLFIRPEDGRVAEANEAAVAAYGYSHGELLGLTVFDLRAGDPRHVVRAQMSQADRAGLTFEAVHRRKDGALFPVEVSSRGADVARERLLLSIVRDISERKRLEADLNRRHEDLAEEYRRKDEFLATLAHELRNPLAPLRNALHILKLCGDDRDASERARALMERQLGQMVRLIDDLMDLSRITRGKLELRLRRVTLAEVVQAAVETSAPLVESRRHQLSVELPDEPVELNADPARLAQVFSNLLNNAAKYTPPGGAIRVCAGREGADVLVRVRDNGVGIRPESLASVFEPFTQVDGAREQAEGGLGIGLTLVKRLVEMHGGTVAARSEGVGSGSEFTVRIPAAGAAAGAAPAEAPADEPASAAACPAARPLRVLVVDDNRDAADTLGLLLRTAGHEVRLAYHGHEVLGAAVGFRPEVLVLDIGLPGKSGYELAREVRLQDWGRSALLVALTGWGQESDRLRSREAGFDHHFVKPLDVDVLQRLLAGRPAAPRG